MYVFIIVTYYTTILSSSRKLATNYCYNFAVSRTYRCVRDELQWTLIMSEHRALDLSLRYNAIASERTELQQRTLLALLLYIIFEYNY